MSLLNQVLRDLDARKAGNTARAGLPAAVTPLSVRMARQPVVYRWWLAGLAVAGLATLAIWRWQTSPPTANISAPTMQARVAPPPVRSPDEVASMTNPSAAPVIDDAKKHVMAKPRSSPPELHSETTLHFRPAVKAVTDGAVAATQAPRPKTAAVDSLPAVSSPDEDNATKIEKKPHQATAAERAENAYRQGMAWQQQGRLENALESYRNALDAQADHVAARQALVTLLLQLHRADEAEDVLTRGMALPSSALPSLLTLGRLRVDRDDAAAALQLLLEHADIGARSAEYEGFLATLLNRAGHHDEATEHYRRATRLAPRDARWWAGLGIALEAQGQSAMAREAYVRARDLPGLPDELAKHVEQRLHQ